MAPLSTLKEGSSSVIAKIGDNINSSERRRLLDLGLFPGVTIRNLFKSAAGEPVAYEVLGTVVALRKEQAEKIFLKEN